jgi:predicted alpha/beta-hydrolase family hydrolase
MKADRRNPRCYRKSIVGASFPFAVGDAHTTARIYRAEGARAALMLAHGAGAPQAHPWMVHMAEALAVRGLDVVTFDFLYMAARRRLPDKNDVLEATWRAAVAAVRARSDVAHARLFLGGKSMGGRIATQVVAAAPPDLGPIAGVVLLGYPLHPPGRPDKLRTAHLGAIRVPMLFVQGSRDAFGSPEELRPFVAPLADHGTRIFPVEGGDHSLSLALGKRKGGERRTVDESVDESVGAVADEIARFAGVSG